MYLHRLTNVRFRLEESLRLKKLCGDVFYPIVIFANTMWEKASTTVGKLGEKELQGSGPLGPSPALLLAN